MHTVRNRVASRPRPPRSSTKGKVPRSAALVAPTRREPAFLLRHPNPPAFPEHLILPAPRGAVIASVPWPERPVTPKAPARKKRGKNDKGKTLKGKLEAKQCRPSPPRKATRRKAADARKPASQEAELPMAARPPAAMPSAPNVQPGSDATVAMTMIDLLDRAGDGARASLSTNRIPFGQSLRNDGRSHAAAAFAYPHASARQRPF